jgi:hypothetical protein
MVLMGRPALAAILCIAGANAVQLRRQAEAAPLALGQISALKDGSWKPDDLVVVDQAIRGLLKLSLSPEKHQKIQETADKVRKDLEPVTSNKTLTNQARRDLVTSALKEIGGLSVVLTPRAPVDGKNATAMKAKLIAMKKELASKTAMLSEEEQELKLDVLKKELVEKKMQLHKLLNKKRHAKMEVASQDDMEAQSKMVAKLVEMANAVKSDKAGKADKPAALQEIGGLSVVLTPRAPVDGKNATAMKAKLIAMKKELASKTAMLSEEEQELKLDVLKKELVEKKMQLHKLLNKKRHAKMEVASQDDMEAQSKMVAKLVEMANAVKSDKAGKADKPAALQAIEVDLTKRTVALKADIAKIDSQEQKTVKDMDAVASANIPHLNKDDALAKGQVLLDSLKKEEHRKFDKARALKKAELAELQKAIVSIDKGDVKALTEILSKMKHETKDMDARSGRFLH